jgi:hypothetical protein
MSWTKKIGKAAGGELRPGEQLVAGMFLQPAGTAGQMIGRGVGGIVGSAVASKLRTKDDGSIASDSGTAATLPDKKVALGLTDRRVLVYGFGGLSGKPKTLLTSFAREALAGVDVEGGKLSNRITLVFADGSGKVYEAPRMNAGTDEFVSALGSG